MVIVTEPDTSEVWPMTVLYDTGQPVPPLGWTINEPCTDPTHADDIDVTHHFCFRLNASCARCFRCKKVWLANRSYAMIADGNTLKVRVRRPHGERVT